MKKYFLSHATKDKSVVTEVYNQLKPKSAWIDIVDIEVGDLILEKITKGIEENDEFLLFWSKHSAESRWVKLELNMAFIKWVREMNVHIRVIKLDNSELPLYLKPFLFLDCSEKPLEAPQEIINLLDKYSHSYTEHSKRRMFVNRHKEIERLEGCIGVKDVHQILLRGVYGIGKRSLARRALETVYSPVEILNIELKPGFDAIKLLMTLNDKMNKPVPIDGMSYNELIKEICDNIEILHSMGVNIIISDVQFWLDSDRCPNRLFSDLLKFISEKDYFESMPIILTSTQQVNATRVHSEKYKLQDIYIDGLSDEHLAKIINYWLSLEKGEIRENSEDVVNIATLLHGYPLAAKVAAGMISQYGAKMLFEYQIRVNELKIDIAKIILDNIKLSTDSTTILKALAMLDIPVSATDISCALGYDADSLFNIIEEISAFNLLQIAGGLFNIHPLIKDYYWRQSTQETKITDSLLNKLLKYYLEELEKQKNSPNIDIKIVQIVFRLLALSGDIKKALSIRADLIGEIERVTKDLYQLQDYTRALEYSKYVLEFDKSNWDMKLICARCLTRSGDHESSDKMLREMLQQRPESVSVLHALGRNMMYQDEWESALKYFSGALKIRGDHVQSIRESAECYIRLQKFSEAEGLIQTLKKLDTANPYVLQIESILYEAQGEYQKAIEIIDLAVRKQPDNATFHHRKGRIAEILGQVGVAITEYQTALNINPRMIESHMSLCKNLIDENIELAQKEIIVLKTKIDELKLGFKQKAVCASIESKMFLKIGDLDAAESAIDGYRGDVIMFQTASIELAKGISKIKQGYTAAAQLHFNKALTICHNINPNKLVARQPLEELQKRIESYIK